MSGWREPAAEFAGTALLLGLVLSAVVANFAAGAPLVTAVPSADLRRLFTGVFTGVVVALIVYSPLGRISGGHLNPAVTLAFLQLGKLTGSRAAGYIAAQFAGALLGTAVVALAWGNQADSVHMGATLPGPAGAIPALGAEAAMVFLLVTVILNFVDRPRLMPFTAAAAGAIIALLAFTESPVSGTSLNPARSFGPALLSGVWLSLWVYLVAPPLGALVAALLYRGRRQTVACGKLIHDESYTCHFLDCQYPSRPDPSFPVQERAVGHGLPRRPGRER